jgi:CTP synthase (UTP-ammonia lyase)
LGHREAEHAESAPDAASPVIARLACSLAGRQQAVAIAADSAAYRFYGQKEAIEQFRCSYGLNPDYQAMFDAGPLSIAGTGPEGEARIIELAGHPFYLATLFLPQLSSQPGAPHPLIVAFLKAALDFQHGQPGNEDATLLRHS